MLGEFHTDSILLHNMIDCTTDAVAEGGNNIDISNNNIRSESKQILSIRKAMLG